MKTTLGFIPARGGSKGIPSKNLKLLNGKPLIQYTIEAALSSKLTKTIVSTDSQDILDLSTSLGTEAPYLRPDELSGDKALIEDAILHLLDYLKKKEGFTPDQIMILQPTSPFRKSHHIDEALQLLESEDGDSLLSVSEPMEHPGDMVYFKDHTMHSVLNIDQREARQNFDKCYFNTGAIYLFERDVLEKKTSRFGERVLPYPMRSIDSIDIDTPDDFLIAEALMKHYNGPANL